MKAGLRAIGLIGVALLGAVMIAPRLSLAQSPFPSIQVELPKIEAPPYLDHSAFTEILKKIVNKKGLVDYRAFKRDKETQAHLNDYLSDLMKIDGTSLEIDGDRMAYFLNLYNGLILSEIIKRYPVLSVAQIPNFFDEARYEIAGFPGRKISLLDLEQFFRDKFNDPRLHLVRVNGAMSAAVLNTEAFEAPKFEKQLEEATMNFLKDPTKGTYVYQKNIYYASPVFLWFEADFNKYLISPRAFLISRLRLPPSCQVQYGGYDWKLNDARYR